MSNGRLLTIIVFGSSPAKERGKIILIKYIEYKGIV